MFKRTVLAAVALSFIAAPMAMAQQGHNAPPQQNQNYKQPQKPGFQAPKKHQAQPPRHNDRPFQNKWSKGHKVNNWQQRPPVRDYHRYGLQRPARGQGWVQVDNNFMLINLATGIIASIAAQR